MIDWMNVSKEIVMKKLLLALLILIAIAAIAAFIPESGPGPTEEPRRIRDWHMVPTRVRPVTSTDCAGRRTVMPV